MNAVQDSAMPINARTTIFDGSAAIEISNNRYNLIPPPPKPCKKSGEQCDNVHVGPCCKGLSCLGVLPATREVNGKDNIWVSLSLLTSFSPS